MITMWVPTPTPGLCVLDVSKGGLTVPACLPGAQAAYSSTQDVGMDRVDYEPAQVFTLILWPQRSKNSSVTI